jgi:hypothetical protein
MVRNTVTDNIILLASRVGLIIGVAGLVFVMLSIFFTGCTPAPQSFGLSAVARKNAAPPPFHGKPAHKPVDYDLTGTWKVWLYETPERKSKRERWEATWLLVKKPEGYWVDGNGQGSFRLENVYGLQEPGVPQYLHWTKPNDTAVYFSINKQSFGLLRMTDEEGEEYMAVRTD